MSSVRDAAYDAIPGYRDARVGASTAQAYRFGPPASDARANFATAEAAFEAGVQRAAEAMASGQPIPLDLGDAFVEAERYDEASRARANMISRAAHSYSASDVTNLVVQGSAAAFEYLQAELDALLDQARVDARAVANIPDGTAALVAGGETIAAWSRLAAHTSWYDEIRQTQESILKEVDRANGSLHMYALRLESFLYRDGIDRHPHWTTRRLRAVTQSHPEGDAARDWVAWLNDCDRPGDDYEDPTNVRWWTRNDRVADLVDIVLRRQPWVPDHRTLAKLWVAAPAAVTAVNGSVPSSKALTARAEVYRLTGTTSRFAIEHTPAAQTQMLDDGSSNIYRSQKQIRDQREHDRQITEAKESERAAAADGEAAASKLEKKVRAAKRRTETQATHDRKTREWNAGRD